jgi:hypothetical protein
LNIRFISSLTPDDEDLLAPALIKAIAALLDQVHLAYSLKIETSGAQVLHHTHPAVYREAGVALSPDAG